MKKSIDNTIVASLIIAIAIVLSTLLYSIFEERTEQKRYSLIKVDRSQYQALKIDHQTGKVWGITNRYQAEIPKAEE